MNTTRRTTYQSLLLFALLASTFTLNVHAASSLLRVTCDDDGVGAEVSINGEYKGECPVDIKVGAGTIQVRVLKAVDASHERVFEQELRMGEGIVKKIEAVLSAPRLNPNGQQLENDRLMEAVKRESERQMLLAEVERQRQAKINAELAMALRQGAEVGNGKSFQDCPDCPPLVLVSASGREPVGVGQFEITKGQFSAFVFDTKREMHSLCTVWVGGWFTDLGKMWQLKTDRNWQSPGFKQSDEHPVVCTSWHDAQAYVAWLSAKTGHHYRLPTFDWWSVLAGGEYGKGVNAPWDADPTSLCQYGNLYDQVAHQTASKGLGDPYACKDNYPHTAPVGSYQPNKVGIYDTFGNVSEWLEDMDEQMYKRYGSSAAAMEPRRIRGASWATSPTNWGGRQHSYANDHHQTTGFRVMRDLTPTAVSTDLAAVKTFHENGKLKSETFHNPQNKAKEKTLWYDQEGLLKSEELFSSATSKVVTFYSDNGQKTTEETFIDGTRVRLCAFQANGNLKSQTFHNPQNKAKEKTLWYDQEGLLKSEELFSSATSKVVTFYSDNGQKTTEETFIDGTRVRLCAFHANGNLKSETFYNPQNKATEKTLWYDQDGLLQSEEPPPES